MKDIQFLSEYGIFQPAQPEQGLGAETLARNNLPTQPTGVDFSSRSSSIVLVVIDHSENEKTHEDQKGTCSRKARPTSPHIYLTGYPPGSMAFRLPDSAPGEKYPRYRSRSQTNCLYVPQRRSSCG